MKTKVIAPNIKPLITVDLNTVIEKEGIYQPVRFPEARLVTISNTEEGVATFYCNSSLDITEPLEVAAWRSDKFIVMDETLELSFRKK